MSAKRTGCFAGWSGLRTRHSKLGQTRKSGPVVFPERQTVCRRRGLGLMSWSSESGVTLTELIIVIAILSILGSAAVPAVEFEVKRRKEQELRADLWEMRRAIDMSKDVADMGGIQTKADSNNYPPDLQTLVDGVTVKDHKMRFLRSIPVDPMTGNTDWGLRSNQDAPDSTTFGGQDVYDVYSKSTGTALDGTKYNTW